LHLQRENHSTHIGRGSSGCSRQTNFEWILIRMSPMSQYGESILYKLQFDCGQFPATGNGFAIKKLRRRSNSRKYYLGVLNF
jgi:hypothetical protein